MTTIPTNQSTETEKSPAPFALLWQFFSRPSSAFSVIEKQSMVILPLFLAMFGTSLVFFLYYYYVDISWLQDKLFTGNGLTATQRAATKQFINKDMLTAISVLGAFITPLLQFALSAGYLLFVAKLTKLSIGYTKWFAFTAWCSVPAALLIPVGIIQIFIAPQGKLTPNQLNPFTLNQLFFHIEMNQPWATLLDSINVTNLWTVVLAVIGFQTWSKKSRASSAAIILVPYIVIYGVLIVLNLMGNRIT